MEVTQVKEREPLLTLREAALTLSLGEGDVRLLVHLGFLNAEKRRDALLFQLAELDDFLTKYAH